MATMSVAGIIPRNIFGINLPSTAELKAKMAKAKQERQEKKDNKIFEDIRSQLVEKVFERTNSDLKRMNKFIEKYKKYEQDGVSEASSVDNSMNIANGAYETINSKKRNREQFALSSIFSIGGIATTIAGVFNPGVSIPLTLLGAGITGISVIVQGIYLLIDKIRAKKGDKSDFIVKYKDSIEKLNIILTKIEKFKTEIENDKEMLISKKKSMSKSEFDAFLDSYLKGKVDFLKEIGANDFLKQLGEEINANESVKENASQQQLAGANA